MTHDRTPPWSDHTADLLAGAIWQKSSYSGTQGNCVEVATNLPGLVAVRDSKNPDGPRLVVSIEAWRGLVRSLNDRSVADSAFRCSADRLLG